MALELKEQTTEQQQQEKTQQAARQKQATEAITNSDVFKSLDLPGEVEKEEVAEKEVAEPEVEEEAVAEEAEQSETEETDEEVVPKSKIQPKIDKLMSQIKYLQNELEKVKISTADPSKDETVRKLEGMTEEQLKSLKRQTRLAQIKAKDDEAQLSNLLDLEEKIDEVMVSAPKRFSLAQEEEYNRAADRISLEAQTEGLALDEKTAQKIRSYASEIYHSTPELQKSRFGQAKALELGYRHFREMSKLSQGNESVSKLKNQVNTLKRKTSLDTKAVKGNMDASRIQGLRDRASRGTVRDKIAMVREDPRFNVDSMIPDEFKET